ncbi:MAG: type III-B CRISPR-associated protein Cas10/Cmr2 [Symploca sp. SIO2D2]|nr:type III-B CRISPR-associated protein Cas10/Cmr2 [Symploca sp. SIO2D2]
MCEAFWQAKIWGLLNEPALKTLYNRSGEEETSFWLDLEVMQKWQEKGWNPETTISDIFQHLHLADSIISASDRAAISSFPDNYACGEQGVDISHLLSGANLHLKVPQQQKNLLDIIPDGVKTDIKCLYWWLWRCLPQVTCDQFDNDSLLLMPAQTSLPDSSVWNYASLRAAFAGALAGYDLTTADLEKQGASDKPLSHPYLVTFTFCPVQELIKASRKMRDFWAGSWILHYLSAKICWRLAQQYGPDSLLYPSLYQQPLIDHWLLQEWPEAFKPWVKKVEQRPLLTAGFPNVLVLILPKDKVSAAMQTAKQTLIETWRDLGKKVYQELHGKRRWMPQLQLNSHSWNGWIEVQWQDYWSAVPIGVDQYNSQNQKIPLENEAIAQQELAPWVEVQNSAYNLTKNKQKLFPAEELNFIRTAYQEQKPDQKVRVNVGSWWPYIFDQTRLALAATKNARNWQIPTAFGPRSTISGIGPVVHPGADWVTEGDTKKHWRRHAGLFDGTEQLNATETIKRGLEKILPKLLADESTEFSESIAASYPDLTAGVAGYLKVSADAEINHRASFHAACDAIVKKFSWAENVIKEMRGKWGIPLVDESSAPKKYHPRLLNAGWLVEDAETDELEKLQQELNRENDPIKIDSLNRQIKKLKEGYKEGIQDIIDNYYPSNNPTSWYVLAAGDGDGMSEWLKGKKLKNYRDYIAPNLSIPDSLQETFEQFLDLPKRMGPSTHSALSRALLDFSNQLVPYLTQQRYAGRLIYAGGDDVLAYTNLWEWDKWLWDIRQCFRGDKDKQFDNRGDYWLGTDLTLPKHLRKRPFFTMGRQATISFGIVIAHHSVPLAIALENLWDAEKEGGKKHKSPDGKQKDAVQIRVIYSNGNILKATAKFDVFHLWQQLLEVNSQAGSAIFEGAATLWSQHPAPIVDALEAWTKTFCDRRDLFKSNDQDNDTAKNEFQQHLKEFLEALWQTTPEKELDQEVKFWLKLAAFVLRNREIKINPEKLS